MSAKEMCFMSGLNWSQLNAMDSEEEILIDSKEIKHNLEEFEKVKKEIEEINSENLTVFMESTGATSIVFASTQIYNNYIKEKNSTQSISIFDNGTGTICYNIRK